MKLSVIIPVLNEEATTRKILEKVILQKTVFEIIVVNDGSTDKTAEILNMLKKIKRFKGKLKIINHKKNLGKGAALCTGIKKAKGECILVQDADLEYDPKDYGRLLSYLAQKTCVYGSRIMSGNPHAYFRTYLGNILLTSFCNVLFGGHLTDSYTCYKLIPAGIARSLKLRSRGFEIEAEITAKLLKKKIPITEVPIRYKPRSYEKGKKIKARDAIKGLFTFLKVKFD